jgi:hypothetical protein
MRQKNSWRDYSIAELNREIERAVSEYIIKYKDALERDTRRRKYYRSEQKMYNRMTKYLYKVVENMKVVRDAEIYLFGS